MTQTYAGPVETSFSTAGDKVLVKANIPRTSDTITGGTGAYEDASGTGGCVIHSTGEMTPGSTNYTSFWQLDCEMDIIAPHRP
jgi:hypothetical protein